MEKKENSKKALETKEENAAIHFYKPKQFRD